LGEQLVAGGLQGVGAQVHRGALRQRRRLLQRLAAERFNE